MVWSPLWCGLGNIHGFVLDGKPYRQGWATAQTINEPAVSDMGVKMSIQCVCNLSTIVNGRWSLVTNNHMKLHDALCPNSNRQGGRF